MAGGRRGDRRDRKPHSGIGRRPLARKPDKGERRPPLKTQAQPQPQRKPPRRRSFPEVRVGAPLPVRAGEWLYTTRPGCERDLVEELFFTDERTQPRLAGPSLVAAVQRPERHGQEPIELAFARQGFRVAAITSANADEALPPLIAALDAAARVRPHKHAAERSRTWALDVWVPDADETNPLAHEASELERAIVEKLSAQPAWAARRVTEARAALTENGLYAQMCMMADGRLAVGAGPAREAPSLAPGGRLRVHVSESAPSRAAMKLVEALTWLDRDPEPGDQCVDLGAAPGGWTWVLLERRARVIAVDPGNLAPPLRGKKGLEHIRADAFKVELEEPVDWLFCDMAFRPLEVAGLLAKWARRGWARMLVANLKLPMKKKAEMLFRVRDILSDGGWQHLRVRQLYHDRDEVTVAGVRFD